ncbi:hypothetical protein Acsp05_63440 [Actinokineospora sp. NBRC 105648]|nr:hypothetical protein Acsp05_63440 [Actinokineospora sp. NBRC 105648]
MDLWTGLAGRSVRVAAVGERSAGVEVARDVVGVTGGEAVEVARGVAGGVERGAVGVTKLGAAWPAVGRRPALFGLGAGGRCGAARGLAVGRFVPWGEAVRLGVVREFASRLLRVGRSPEWAGVGRCQVSWTGVAPGFRVVGAAPRTVGVWPSSALGGGRVATPPRWMGRLPADRVATIGRAGTTGYVELPRRGEGAAR